MFGVTSLGSPKGVSMGDGKTVPGRQEDRNTTETIKGQVNRSTIY